jgi:hypothetical protein
MSVMPGQIQFQLAAIDIVEEALQSKLNDIPSRQSRCPTVGLPIKSLCKTDVDRRVQSAGYRHLVGSLAWRRIC